MKRQVVDSNYLRDPALRTYLASSRSNFIVMTDFVAMEMHRKNALSTTRNSMAIACDFPGQILVLRDSSYVIAMRGNIGGYPKRLVDQKQSIGMPDYCSLLQNAANTPANRAYIEESQTIAAGHFDRLTAECAEVPAIFSQITASFNTLELTSLRERLPYTERLQQKLLESMHEVCKALFRSSRLPLSAWPRTNGNAFNTFVFRYAMCLVLLYTRWVQDGRQLARKPERVRNDVVDMNIAATSTYFSGVLSKDQKLVGVQREARYLLRAIGAYVGS